MDNRQHIGTEHFDKLNWVTTDQKFKQCLPTSIFKFSFEMCPQYMKNKTLPQLNLDQQMKEMKTLKHHQIQQILPKFSSTPQRSKYTRGNYLAHVFETNVSLVYEQNVYRKKSLFLLPSGKAEKQLIDVATKLMNE